MSGVRGDFNGLNKLIVGLHRMSGVDKKLAELAAPDVGAEAAKTFDAGESPYGEKWPATKTQGPRVLNDSGALRAGATTFTPQGAKLRINIPQHGRYQFPPFFWPSGNNPPESWLKAAEKHLPAAVEAVIEGR